ncbi:MAG: carboxypeptidase regulatory-like domain-containing protein [Bacteroidales bacterium]
MRNLTRFLLFIALGVFAAVSGYSQITTSGINGKVTNPDGSPLPGATVIATHVPTGSLFGATTDDGGFYRLPNMDVGGPYTVKVSFVGFESWTKENIYLTLGQTSKVDANLKSTEVRLGEVAVIGKKSNVNVFDGNRTGAQTVVPLEKLEVMPTIGRDLTDFTRLVPQASVDDNGAITIAGVNNRYNALMIDGAAQNDVFGLAASGVNGGQTGGTPISMDAIEQFQVTLAPYDVRHSGFAGAGINAVTRRGTNKFSGSVYTFFRNQDLSGKTPTSIQPVDSLRTQLAPYKAQTTGFRLGGPIIKNKLFFFINGEFQREQTPQPFDVATYGGASSANGLDSLSNFVKTNYNYDTGVYDANTRELNSNKLLARLDWNINEHNKLMLRHSYTYNESIGPSRSSNRTISFYNGGIYFPSTTNATTLELKSNYANLSNSLLMGYTTVVDDRDPMGANFPSVIINDGNGTIYFGSEAFSAGNSLSQKIFTLTDNLTLYKGKHTITLGTSNEFADVYNLFVRQMYGEYRFKSVADFYANKPYQYDRSYSLVDDITGDGSAAAANFQMAQVGLYAQDEFRVSDNFKLSFGIRGDMPIFMDSPKQNPVFDSLTIPKIIAAGWDSTLMSGVRAGQMPKSQILFSPRIGFNWDISGEEKTQIRGGVGIFTSRLPLVWPGGAYSNCGMLVGGTRQTTGITFNPDWNTQPTATDFGKTDAVPSGQVDLFTKSFKFPQVFRANIGIDQKLSWNMVLTLEGIFTKTINNVVYYNLNVDPDAAYTLTGTPDTRNYYNNAAVDKTYTRIILADNTNQGYGYNLTASIEKPFDNGFTANVAYTFGRALALNDATSSQNSSQWRYMETYTGLNHLTLSTSDFDLGHRILAFASYRVEYLKHAATTISVYFNGQSGYHYSYVYNDVNGLLDGEKENVGNLIYIPAAKGDIIFKDAATAEQQWTDLNAYIEGDKYLNAHRGAYAERNSARTPFAKIVDLRLAQDIFVDALGTRQKLQITFDIFNLGNMINKDWGHRYYVTNDAFQLIKFEAFTNDSNGKPTIPTFSFKTPTSTLNTDDSGVRSARWMAMIGVRYSF